MEDKTRIVECEKCGRKWLAVCFQINDRLECPDCGYLTQVPPQNTMEENNTSTNKHITHALQEIADQMDFLVSQNYDKTTIPLELLRAWSRQLRNV